jgi:hypothetical protein
MIIEKETNFYYKIFLAILAIEFLNIAYLFYRHMSGDVSFYFFRLSEKTIFIILSLFTMPINYALIALTTLLIKKTSRNLFICASVLSIVSLFLIHTNTSAANYNYKQEKIIDAMNLEYFEWEGTNNVPLGYPIDVYEGGLESKDGGYTGLSLGTSSGIHGWGAIGAGMSSNRKAVPDRLNVTWLSYAEDTFYHIDCPIDYDKMVRYFKEGFEEREISGSGKTRHETYRYIIVGYAPGGIVVIWLSNGGKQVEIGRYQGEKTVIDPEEIKSLESPEKLLFKQSYRDETMNDENIVPTAVREANKKKPIPYGLWDTYREKYLWKPTFIQNKFSDNTFTMVYARLEMYNGEIDDLFKETLQKKEYTERAILKRINFGWKDEKGQVYSGSVEFDEKTIFDAFKEIRQDTKNGKIEIEFMVNIPNDFVVVRLRSGDKWVFANKDSKVDVFKSSKKYNN